MGGFFLGGGGKRLAITRRGRHYRRCCYCHLRFPLGFFPKYLSWYHPSMPGVFLGGAGPLRKENKKKKKKEKESTNTPKPKYTTYPSIHYSIHIQIHPPSGILEGEENVLWKFPVEVHDPAYSCCVFCCAELEIPPVARVRSVLVFFFFFFFFSPMGVCAQLKSLPR